MRICIGLCKPIPKPYHAYKNDYIYCVPCELWTRTDVRHCVCCGSLYRRHTKNNKFKIDHKRIT